LKEKVILSADTPIGVPYNVAQYSLLLAMLAHVTDMEPHEFIHSVGDAHIYLHQMESTSDIKEGVETQLQREPLPYPKLWLNPEVKDLFKFTSEDIKILDYQSHPAIRYPVAL
jgi:thymidylate synthase